MLGDSRRRVVHTAAQLAALILEVLGDIAADLPNHPDLLWDCERDQSDPPPAEPGMRRKPREKFRRPKREGALGEARWLLWVELWPRVMNEPALREAQFEFVAVWRAAIARILRELTDDVETLTQRVFALIDGLSVALLTGDTTLTAEQAWQHVKALLPTS